MASIIIRPAVQKQIDDEKRWEEIDRQSREKRDLSISHQAHSAESQEALAEWLPPGGILLSPTNADWWRWGYDAAMAEIESRDLLDGAEN